MLLWSWPQFTYYVLPSALLCRISWLAGYQLCTIDVPLQWLPLHFCSSQPGMSALSTSRQWETLTLCGGMWLGEFLQSPEHQHEDIMAQSPDSGIRCLVWILILPLTSYVIWSKTSSSLCASTLSLSAGCRIGPTPWNSVRGLEQYLIQSSG